MKILITGTMGVGKTTIIKKLENLLDCTIFEEDLSNPYFNKLISKPKEWAYIGQFDYFLSRIKKYVFTNSKQNIQIFDRNWIDDQIFLKYHYQCNNITKEDYETLIPIYRKIMSKLNVDMDLIIVLQAPFESIENRVYKRSRIDGEQRGEDCRKKLYDIYYNDNEIKKYLEKNTTQIKFIENIEIDSTVEEILKIIKQG